MPVEKGYARTALGQLHYRRQGRGPTLVLLPHSGRSSRMYDRLATELSSRFDVVAFDLPGSGESCPLPPGTLYEDIAAALVEALRALRLGSVDLYGIHTGNKIGACLAAAGSLRRVVLAGQTHSLVVDGRRRNELIRGVASAVFATSGTPGLDAVSEWCAALARVQSTGLAAAALTAIARRGDYAAECAEAIDHLQGWAARRELYEGNFAFDLERSLRGIAIPTLVLEIATPTEDRDIGRQGPHVLDVVPGARLVTLEEQDGIGFTMEHRAAEIAGIVGDFLLN